jgi:iron complex outermembrane receptor protein
MKKIYLLMLCAMLAMAAQAATVIKTTTLSGQVTDALDHSPLIGVTVFIPELSEGTTTDESGHYHFNALPAKTLTLQVSYLGHQTIIRTVDLTQTTTADFVMAESNALLNEVVVTGLAGTSLMKQSPTPVSVVTQSDLFQTTSTNIIDALAHNPGISQVTTGSGISKPVIRGLGYNRIVTIDDGVRLEGQQWGDEHGIEVDPQSVNNIEVLKGPASLRYGSDAMAGVIIFHDAPTLPRGKVNAGVTSEYQTNNGLFDYSLYADGNQNGWLWGVRYSAKWAHAYKNPYDGYVLNSQFHERAFSARLGLSRNWGYSHLKLSYYHLTPSMVEGERDEETGAFVYPVAVDGEEETAVATEDILKRYGKGMPYQQIHHYKAVLDNSFYVGNGTLKALVGYQQNRRQEFEDVLSPSTPGLDFMLHTINYDVNYNQTLANLWKTTVGVGGMYQRSLNKGEEVLIPSYALFDFGVYATTAIQLGSWSLSGGLRYDTRHVHSFALEDHFDKFSRDFNALTGSIGAVYALGSNMNFRLNLARGFRAPNLSELGANGEHEGTFRYEKGNTALKPEHSWQVDAGWDYTTPWVTMQASLFANFIDNYVFASRLGNETEEGLPVYQYTQGNARLLGGEVSVDIHPIETLHFENAFSWVDAVQKDQPRESKYLPMTPAPRWTSDLKYDFIRHGRTFNNLFARIGTDVNFRQNHYYAADNTETATPAYVLLNASVGTDVLVKGRKIMSIVLTGDNLTNKAYQSHLSRLKYADVNPVTGRQGIYNMGRNIGVKVMVPLEF